MIEVTTVPVSFSDHRGTTTNIVQATVHNVAIIRSRDGAIRGNHVHREQAHYEFVIEGALEIARISADGQVETRVIYAGDMVYTPPGVPHAFRSLQHSVILHMVDRPIGGGFHEADTEKAAVL